MTQSFNHTILEEAILWIESGQQVALATVVQTWGSSPFQIGSKMIIDEMSSVVQSDHHSFSIPLTVDLNFGDNWGTLH